jgi:hypothetical protein
MVGIKSDEDLWNIHGMVNNGKVIPDGQQMSKEFSKR